MTNPERVAIVGGKRSPFTKAGGALKNISAKVLLAETIKAAMQSVPEGKFLPQEVFLGTVLLNPRFPNLARDALFEAGLSPEIPAQFVANNCITGLVAASIASEAIRAGRISTALAGGVESMSNTTLTYQPKAEAFFRKLFAARSIGDRIKVLSSLRPSLFFPEVPSPKEPSTGLTMGQHCELMVQAFGIGREQQDALALASHKNAAKAEADGAFDFERFSLGEVSKDSLIRADTTAEKLAKLPPVFAKAPKGTLTAGNSSALTDGASVVCLAAESEAKKSGLEILGFIEGIEFTALHPNDGLLMAPTTAIPKVLHRLGLGIEDIDIFEIHEAFAGQVLCNLRGLEIGFMGEPPFGSIPRDKMNFHGGSLALGHPFAATGGRLLLSAVNILKRQNKKRALLSACAAGGMGAACVVSRE